MTMHDTETATHPPRTHLHWLPVTQLGRVGLALGVLGVLLMPAWMLFGPLGAFPQFALMAVGGACTLVAILRRRERAVLAFAGLLPLLLVVVSVVGEFVVPH